MSGACDSFAGIAVPEGDPGALRDAAGRFQTLGHQLSGVSGELRGMPSSMASWAGPASVAYAGTCLTNGAACDTAVDAMGQCAQAARQYAHALQQAQDLAKEAIAEARDAQARIDQAERDIGTALDRQATAALAIRSAETEISIAMAAAQPAPAAEAARGQAQSALYDAQGDEQRARRMLEKAQDDLERAKRKGRRAAEHARDAGRGAASAFHGAAGISPAYAVAGGAPAAQTGGPGSTWWDTKNEGAQWWDEDQFLGQLIFFHPENDTVGHYKWWGDRVLDVGMGPAGNALVGLGTSRLQAGAISRQAFLDIGYTRQFVAGRGGTTLVEGYTISRTTADVIDSGKWAQAMKFGRVGGKAVPIVGGAVSIASAGWDQWRQDEGNPNLTTTDRVGRAAGVGTYVGGASIAGAVIGTAIFPGVGTVAGLAIGATAGLVVGATASAITPLKDASAAAGQWTANAAVDSYHYVGDKIGEAQAWADDKLDDIGSGISSGIDSVKDHLPDVDLPDLNPF